MGSNLDYHSIPMTLLPRRPVKNKAVVRAPEEMSLVEGSFSAVLTGLLKNLQPRVQAIIQARFGLSGKEAQTLEKIGQSYGITRERVRQIIRGAVKDIRAKKNAEQIDAVGRRIVSTLESHHGIMTEGAFYAELGQGSAAEAGALRFFVENFADIQMVKESSVWEPSLAVKRFPFDQWEAVIAAATEVFEQAKQPLDEENLHVAVARKDPSFESVLLDHLATAKAIKRSAFRLWGFAAWSDIVPKGAREKAYLVLKSTARPLHFREIAELIDRHQLQKRGKATHSQTVHNELIKDKRFVLVGRGVYALVEWGFARGTVREILTDILEKAGKPLDREDILERIDALRQVKRSTVVINLNTYFIRVGKTAYTVKKQ